MDADLMDASRFLAQATLGANMEEIQRTADLGFEAWIDQQLNQPTTKLQPVVIDIVDEIQLYWNLQGLDLNEFYGPWALHFNYAWWQVNMTNEDLLRQRVALALSEILVISANSDLIDDGVALANYYDMLAEGAFGNYEDLLKKVTYHINMGFYLSHLNNPKTNVIENLRPDQNYAREIMQLFTIGLYELNEDGTKKLDPQGDFIPTYDNNIIAEVSKIFTGLGPGGIADYVDWTNVPYFGLGLYGADKLVPMRMYEQEHETGPKTVFNDIVVNADGNNSGDQDIEEFISLLINHDNTAPFISLRLIQRLVKSNPTKAYITRVSSVFKNNGSGEIGDLGAVIKAILLDPEARECEAMQDPTNGKLMQPLLRYTQLARAFEKDSPLGRYWNNGFDFLESTRQHVLTAPSVFNFYLPDYQPNGAISEANLVAPEFQIHNSRTSLEYINKVNQWMVWDALWWSWEGEIDDEPVSLVTANLENLSEDPENMFHYMDILLTHGQLTEVTKNIIKDATAKIIWGDEIPKDKARLALYLLMISPDFNVFK